MIKIMSPNILELHLSDNDGTEDQHLLPGKGKVPFAKIFDLVSQNQKMPDIMIEAFGSKHNYSDNDLKESLKFIQKLISA